MDAVSSHFKGSLSVASAPAAAPLPGSKAGLLADLARRLAELECGGLSQSGGPAADTRAAVEVGGLGVLARGVVHEWFADPAALDGAGAGEPPRGGGQWVPPLTVMLHAAARALVSVNGARGDGEKGGGREESDHLVVWVGRRVWPGVAALDRAGVPRASLLVDAAAPGERAWAIDLAARSAGVAAVVADGAGLDMACSRRLQLAAASRAADRANGAEGGGALVMLARPWWERRALSAAAARWEVRAVPDGAAPRWEVRQTRCKGAALTGPGGGGAGARVGAGATQWTRVLEIDRASLRLVVPAGLECRPAAVPLATRSA